MPAISEILTNKFPHTPTDGQRELFSLMDHFLESKINSKAAILLKGYAGTGKTSIVSALVQVLPLFNFKFVLLAPTGRAAKVMSAYAKRAAFTIHKKIYKQVSSPGSDRLSFQRVKNYHKKTLFIVDEASMLSESKDFGDLSLLQDLISFVYQHEENRLLLIGDTAQLPPVGMSQSAALDEDHLKSKYNLNLKSLLLTEVMRQELESGILQNATKLRNLLPDIPKKLTFKIAGFSDIYRIPGEKLEDGIRYCYEKYGINQSVIICRSNREAVQFNQVIRRQILFYEEEIDVGDMIMVVRNNYNYKEAPAGFLANGDFVEVRKVISFEEIHGFRFATLSLHFTDYAEIPDFEAKVILDTLHSAEPSLSMENNRKLYQSVLLDYEDLSSTKRQAALKKDPYLNALQIKYAYALTCHKAQGGQWKSAFVSQGYRKDAEVDADFIRWLYTALTRASDELFLINFGDEFFV